MVQQRGRDEGIQQPIGRVNDRSGWMLTKNVPKTLKVLRQWVLWRYEEKGGKPTKVPYQPNGQRAKANDPTTWSTFEAVERAMGRRWDGIGFVFAPGGGIVGIDIDWKGWQGDGVPPEAQAVVDRLKSYTEWSPSGQGVHILLRGELPRGTPHRKELAPGVVLEVYDGGRFFTVTGQYWPGYPQDLEERQEELLALLKDLFPQEAAPSPVALHPAMEGIPGQLQGSYLEDDEELLERMFRSKKGPKIQALWNGDISGYSSHSEADLALASYLMWWTGNDETRADRLFRRSGLYRPKWDERHRGDGRTYGQMTLEKARSLSSYAPWKGSS